MNDWLVANLNNPDFSVSDFKDIADMSIDNTLFLKKDLYLKSDYILNNPMFKGNDGLFNRLKFDLYYDTLLKKFLEFTTDNSIPNGLELDVFDTLRTPNSKVKKDNLFIGRGKNPDRLKIGIEGVNIWSAPEMSRSEIAQTLKVFNTATGKYEDYTPNDKALFNGKTDFGLSWIKSLFSDPLVMALYDKDTTDPDGTKHYKGEYKLNDEGTYYYETLNGRSPIGKLVLSALDILTVDGSNLNKYDFFDSDDIEKSVTGVIAKNVASLIPIFIGGPVGTVYSTALIAREMAKSLPMLYGMTTALFSDSETPKWMNTIAAMGDKFTSGTSDYAKEHAFSVENFGNMIADVALQWGLLKGIANAFNKLKGSNKYMDDALAKAEALYKVKAPTMPELAATVASDWKNSILGQACLKKYLPAAEKAMKESSLLGRDASLAYMAIVSNSDVYNDMLQAGASKKEAAAVALGSTLGMFVVDKYAGLGELFFDDATENSVKAARRVIKNELLGYTDSKGIKHKGVQEIIDTIKAGQDTDANKIVQLIHGTANKVKNLMSNFSDDLKYHTTGFFGKAFGEGLEEVGEEVVTDTAKSIYELAGYLGANTSVKDVGAWDNMLERYTMSFLGGALGGGIFYGVDVIQNGKYRADKTDEELVTLIRNGHINELRDEVEKLRKKGKLGSTKLSASKWESTTDGDNVWLTTNDEADSLNLKIADIINLKITALDSVINNNLVGLSDDELFKNMVLGEQRYYMYLDVAPITDYYEDFNEVLSNLIKAELDYKIASLTLDGSTEITEANKITDEKLRHLTEDLKNARQDALNKLLLKVDEARLAKDAFLSGDSSIDYMRKLNFALDPILHAPFMAIDEKLLWEKDHIKSIEEATPEELMTFLTLTLPEAKKFKTKELVTKSWERFKQVEQTINPELHKFTDSAADYKKWFDDFLKIIPELTSDALKLSYLNWDSKLDTESDEEYLHRNTKFKDETTGVEESNEDFNARRKARITQLEVYNNKLNEDWANNIESKLATIGFNLDPITKNMLINTVMPLRIKDILGMEIAKAQLPSEYEKIVSGLKNDLSNADDIRELVKNFYNTKIVNEVKDYISKLSSVLNPDEGYINPITGKADAGYGMDNVLIVDEENPYTIDEILNNDEVIGSGVNAAGDTVDFTTQDILNSNTELSDALSKLKGYFGEDATIDEIVNGIIDLDISKLDSAFVNDELSILNGHIDNIISNTQHNPIVKLANKLKTSAKNPVIEVTKALVGKVIDKEKLPDIFKILDELQNKFETIDDVSDLLLDAELLKNLNIAKSALLLVSTYLYAASSTPKTDNIVGHNKMFNEYAAKHADRIAKWDTLPEIDEDYATIYQSLLVNLGNYIDYWILLSNNNDINKRKLFIETDKAFTKNYNEFWSKNKDKFKITVKGKDYNLLDGVKDDTTLEINLFNYEKTIYNNFQLALKDSGLSVTEFLEQSKLLDKLIDYDDIDAQLVSKLNPLLKYDDLSEYDKLVYISTILSLDPVDFYNYLKSSILGNSDKAPITTLEYASRVLIAKTTDINKDILNYAYSKSDAYSHNNGNTVICIGDAGSGKTSVVVNNAIKFLPKDTNILCVGPTDTLANNLQESVGKGKKMNVETLFRQLLGDDVYNEIMSDLNINFDVTTNRLVRDSKYFDAISNYGSTAARIKDDSVTFKPLADGPKVIVIDEATHVPSVLLLYLDAYMKLVGGTLILLGDIKQNGFSKPNGIGNMDIGDLFATRTPELNVSLRDNNILKLANLANVKSIVSSILTNIIEMSNADYTAWVQLAIGLLDKIKFRVYNNDTLNGDLITSTLDDSIINKIKGAASIGFIGDASSAAYLALKKAGVDATLLSLEEMQGQEFDYVVIDLKFTKPNPKNPDTFRIFMLNLYTLMSRGKTASIFIDNGLSSIIGKNTVDNYTAKAPSLTDKINGKSAVDLLKERKLQIIELFDLTKSTSSESTPSTTSSPTGTSTSSSTGTTGTSTTPTSTMGTSTAATTTSSIAYTPKPSSTPISTVSLTPEDFTDPDEKHFDEESKKTIDSTVEEEKTKPEVTHKHKFTVMSFGDVDYLGVKTTELTYKDKKGIEHKVDKWDFTPDSEGNLRGLSALRLGKDEEETKNGVSKLTDKLALLDELYALKSILIFGHNWIDPMTGNIAAPAFILDNFNQSDWENGEFEVEFRSVDGEVMPIFGRMPEIGMTYKGDKFIANIVYKVKNKEGKTCIFDICGLNNPETLIDTLLEHKDNLETWKAAASKDGNDARVEELSDILATTDEQVKKYANTFESAYNKFKESPNKHFSIKLSNPTIIRQCHAWFKNRGKHKKKKIRLGGLFDPDNIEKQGNDYIDLMHEASNGVFSDVYTYAAKSKNDLNIDTSLKGRAIIFWSPDKTIKSEELVYKYIALKQDPEHNKPTVRMITLDNYGMSFNLMLDHDFIKKVQGGDTTRLPYRANYVGLSMYVSMWNWRAALKQFKQALDTWMDENKYDLHKVNDITLAANEIYYSKDKDAKKAEWAKKGVTEEDLNKLYKFNKETCNDIMFFRLGQSNKNGFHIQDFEVDSDNYIYPRTKVKSRLKKASFLVVTPEKAALFEQFIDRVFEAINPNNYGIDTPGLQLINAKTGKPWDINEYIDIEEANAKNSLSGLIAPDLSIETKGVTVVYKQGELWSAIPKILSSMVRTLDYFLNNPEEMDDKGGSGKEWSGNAKVTMKDKSGTDRQFAITVKDFIVSGLLHDINHTSEPEGLHPDRSLRDMFDLMFHGTTENIHKPGVHKLNNVRFPNGFYINPDIARVKKSGSSSDIEYIEYNGDIVFYPIKTNPALFTADIELRAAGLDIDADEFGNDFLNAVNPPKVATSPESVSTTISPAVTPTSTEPTVAPKLTENQMTTELFEDLAKKRKCFDEEDLEATIDSMNIYSKNAIIPTVLAGESLTQIFIYTKYNDNIIELKSVFKLLQELTGNEEPTIEYEDDKVFVDGSELDIENMEIKKPIKPADTILDRDYEGKSIGQTVNEFINSETFKELVNNDDWCDESELDNFILAYNLIYLKRNSYPDEESLKAAINGLKDDFGDFTSLIESNNSELYNRLFEC